MSEHLHWNVWARPLTDAEIAAEASADDPFAEPVEPLPKAGPLEHIDTLPNGVWIYRQTTEAGGHRYWSDAIGGGVMIWDTVLASAEELRRVLELEEAREQATLPPPKPQDIRQGTGRIVSVQTRPPLELPDD